MSSETATVLILAIEDSATYAAFLTFLLQERDYCGLHFVVETYATMALAQERLNQTQLPRPDLVVLDLLLPDSSGIRTFDAMYACTTTAILVLTGSEDRDSCAQLIRRGADDVIVKGSITSQQMMWRIWRTVMRTIHGTAQPLEKSAAQVASVAQATADIATAAADITTAVAVLAAATSTVLEEQQDTNGSIPAPATAPAAQTNKE